MRILVCGGRDFGYIDRYQQHHEPDHPAVRKAEKEYQFILDGLETVAKNYSVHFNPDDNWLPSDIEIISGMASGVDSVAVDWAAMNWCKLHPFPADWKKYGKSAGFVRNSQMLEEGKPDLVICFPGGKGTEMMFNLSRKKGIHVIRYLDMLTKEEHNFE